MPTKCTCQELDVEHKCIILSLNHGDIKWDEVNKNADEVLVSAFLRPSTEMVVHAVHR